MPAVTLIAHDRFFTNTEVLDKQKLSVADSVLRKEMEEDFHPSSGKEGFKKPTYGTKVPMSALLNHCYVIKASSVMAKEYLAFMKTAGCSDKELDYLGAKIEIFMTASDVDEVGGNEDIIPKPKKKLVQMNEAELQTEAQRDGIEGWDKMNRSELLKTVSKHRAQTTV